MELPKYLTTVTLFSKILAMILFVAFPIIAFILGSNYQKKSDNVSFSVNKGASVIPTPIKSPHTSGWLRYFSRDFDYCLDYPPDYSYSKDNGTEEIIFTKNADSDQRIDNYIFIQKEPFKEIDQKKIDNLEEMAVGEKKAITLTINQDKIVVVKKDKTMDQFNTYERLPDVIFNNQKVKSFINRKPFEAMPNTVAYLYLYQGKSTYFFGGLINNQDDNVNDNIDGKSFKQIISTIRFLD